MNTAKTALVVTTVVAIGLACIGCTAAANQAQVAQAQPATPTPAARPSALTATAVPTSVATAAPTTRVTVLAGGDVVALEPGRRYALASNITNPEISFVAPAGWTGNERLIGKEYGDGGAVGPLVFSSPFDHGFKDPCKDHTPVVPASGSGTAGLLRVIARQPGIDEGPITDATVGGHDASYVDYTVTVDPATCGKGDDPFWIWGTCPTPPRPGCEIRDNGDRRYGVSKNDRERVYAVDVDGRTVTFFANQPADLLAGDRREFQGVLDSMQFEPAN